MKNRLWSWPLISTGIIYSSRNIYPRLKLLGQSVLELSVAQGLGDMTLDLDLWHTDLNINRDHILTKDYLPTNFEASGAKRSWVIRCTSFGRLTWPLTLTFGILTWISIGVIYSSRTIYLSSLKLLGQKRSWVFSCTRLRDTDIPTDRHVQRNITPYNRIEHSDRIHHIGDGQQ